MAYGLRRLVSLLVLSVSFIIRIDSAAWPRGYVVLPRSACERQLNHYPRRIARHFPLDAVVPDGHGKNIYCFCEDDWPNFMDCNIYVREGSPEEHIIRRRLNRFYMEGSQNLLPFFVIPDVMIPNLLPGDVLPVMYYSGCFPPVVAQIRLYYNPIQRLSRSRSADAILQHPIRFAPLGVCNHGSEETHCPITLNEFEVGDHVYILKNDREKVQKGMNVVCISFEGMMALEQRRPDYQFQDPLRRLGEEPSTIERDYDLYRVIPDVEPDGSCAAGSDPASIEPVAVVPEAGGASSSDAAASSTTVTAPSNVIPQAEPSSDLISSNAAASNNTQADPGPSSSDIERTLDMLRSLQAHTRSLRSLTSQMAGSSSGYGAAMDNAPLTGTPADSDWTRPEDSEEEFRVFDHRIDLGNSPSPPVNQGVPTVTVSLADAISQEQQEEAEFSREQRNVSPSARVPQDYRRPDPMYIRDNIPRVHPTGIGAGVPEPSVPILNRNSPSASSSPQVEDLSSDMVSLGLGSHAPPPPPPAEEHVALSHNFSHQNIILPFILIIFITFYIIRRSMKKAQNNAYVIFDDV